jgi:YD repeat-containing protein
MGVRTETLDINLTDMRRPFSCQPKFTLYGCSKPVNIGVENEIFPLTYCIFSTKKNNYRKALARSANSCSTWQDIEWRSGAMAQMSSHPRGGAFNLRHIVGAVALALAVSGSAHAGTTAYKYDAQNHLIEVDYPNGSKIVYTYDSVGNCTSVVKST